MPTLALTSSIGSNQVPTGFSSNVSFTSQVINIPPGYSVSVNSHIITYPTAVPPTTGSTLTLTGPATPVALAVLGNTFTVNATVVLTHTADPTITLNATLVITAVSPAYFGVLPFSLLPTVVGLTTFASTIPTFQITSTGIGRLIIALPVGSPAILTIEQDNGLIYPVSNFSTVVNASYIFYVLNYDTQFTGAALKTLTIHYV